MNFCQACSARHGKPRESLLKNGRLILSSRGTLKILNREGLELLACECYGAVKDDMDSFLS